MNDKQKFTMAIGALFLAFHIQGSRELFEVWWQALKDIPIEDIQQSVLKVIQTEADSYKPVPGRIRKEVFGGSEPRAMAAWDKLNRAIANVGSYRDPQFTDPKIPAIVNQHGGWARICGLTLTEFDTWFRKLFFSDYETMETSADELVALGIATMTNRSNGKPAAIGEVIAERKLEPPA